MNVVNQVLIHVLCLCAVLVTMSDSRFIQPQTYHEQTRTFQRPNANQRQLEALYRNRHDQITQPNQRQSFSAITHAALQKIKSENRDTQLNAILRNGDDLRTSYNSIKQQNQIPVQRHKININLSNTRHSEDISKPQQRTISINAKIGRNFNFSHRYKGTNIRLQKNGPNTNIFISSQPQASALQVPSAKHSSTPAQTNLKEDTQTIIRPSSNPHQNSSTHALDNEKNIHPKNGLELPQTSQLEQQSAAHVQAAQGLTTGVFDVVTLPDAASKTVTKIPSAQPQSSSLSATAATRSHLDSTDTRMFLSTLATPAHSDVPPTTSADSHLKKKQDASRSTAVKTHRTNHPSSLRSVPAALVTTASPKVTSPSSRDTTTEEIDIPDAGELPD